MLMHDHQPLILEITIISVEGLNTGCQSSFNHGRLRPFVSLTTIPYYQSDTGKHRPVYKTRVGDIVEGCTNPTWGDKFRIPVHTTFFVNRFSAINLQLFTKRLVLGQAQLGWCRISASDIGLLPGCAVRYLSYRLRDKDGSRGRGIVNLAMKVEGLSPNQGLRWSESVSATMESCQTVIGIPVTAFPHVREQ